MPSYSDGFKGRMVQRMTGPVAISANALSQEVGVPQATLSAWLRNARTISAMTPSKPTSSRAGQPTKKWTAEEKYRIVLEAVGIPDQELGAFLRRNGLHEAQLTDWKELASQAAVSALEGNRPSKKAPAASRDSKRLRDLEVELHRKDKALAEVTALLALKKSGLALGGRGREHTAEERAMIINAVEEAVAAGARQSAACDLLEIAPTTLQRWRSQGIGQDQRAGPKTAPKNKLSEAEQARILEAANRPEFRDLSPKEIVAALASRGSYLGSEQSFYRLLRKNDQLNHRGRAKPRTARRPAQYVATGPCQVWSWDITYLRAPVRGVFFYLYVVMDVWSRKIVNFSVEEIEHGEHAIELIRTAADTEGILPGQLVLHQDNGSPMKYGNFTAFLQGLGVAASYSRPRVSDDNAYSEALFRTLKYRPEFPERPFKSIEEARQFAARFVHWYNEIHLHSGIKFVTPAQRHRGEEAGILAERTKVYERARRLHPERWSGRIRDWSPVSEVVLNPGRKRRESAA